MQWRSGRSGRVRRHALMMSLPLSPGTWVYPLPAQPDQDSTAAASPMKGFSSQAGTAFGAAGPADSSAGADPSEAQCNGTTPAAAAQPSTASESAISSQPAAQPDSPSCTAQLERAAEASSRTPAADSNGASGASAAHADGAPSSGRSSTGSAHADAPASPFTRHVQELAAKRGQHDPPDAQVTANGSAAVDAQSLAVEAPHDTPDCTADKGNLDSAARPCSAATCSCGAQDDTSSRPTSDVRSVESTAAAADTEQSPPHTATEAAKSLQSSPDGRDKPGALSAT